MLFSSATNLRPRMKIWSFGLANDYLLYSSKNESRLYFVL